MTDEILYFLFVFGNLFTSLVIQSVKLLDAVFQKVIMGYVRYKQRKHKHRRSEHTEVFGNEKSNKTHKHEQREKYRHKKMDKSFMLHKADLDEHFRFQFCEIGTAVFEGGGNKSDIFAEIFFHRNRSVSQFNSKTVSYQLLIV